MKNFLIILLALVLGAIAGYFVWKEFLGGELNIGTGTVKTKRKVTAENYKEPFMWGVNVAPSLLRNYSLEMWNKQMNIVQKLDTDWIRVGYDYGAEDRLTMYDDMIENSQEKGLNFNLILEPGSDVDKMDNPYEDGYKKASEVAEHFKGKIKYYQILNEQSGGAVKGAEFSGENQSDYDDFKYNKMKEWNKGAINAFRKIDPDAYLIVNVHWTHVAYVEKLIKDKIDFDILGWDWYGDMKMMNERKLADGTLLTDKLKTFNKPILLVEVNDAPRNGVMNENNQAKYISDMAEWAYNSDLIKGFFVHGLLDDPGIQKGEPSQFGIVKYKIGTDGGYTFGDPKKAYYTYQEIIKKYSQ